MMRCEFCRVQPGANSCKKSLHDPSVLLRFYVHALHGACCYDAMCGSSRVIECPLRQNGDTHGVSPSLNYALMSVTEHDAVCGSSRGDGFFSNASKPACHFFSLSTHFNRVLDKPHILSSISAVHSLLPPVSRNCLLLPSPSGTPQSCSVFLARSRRHQQQHAIDLSQFLLFNSSAGVVVPLLPTDAAQHSLLPPVSRISP